MSDEGGVSATLEIVNEKGLHARASAKFAALAEEFDAQITVARDAYRVNARSIMGLLTLAAARGSSIFVSATGPDAERAIEALGALVANRFDEPR